MTGEGIDAARGDVELRIELGQYVAEARLTFDYPEGHVTLVGRARHHQPDVAIGEALAQTRSMMDALNASLE